MRLIDADALSKTIKETCLLAKPWDYTLIEQVIADAPTIDPVKHGKWIKDGETYALYKCSACNDLCTVAGYANCIPEEQMYKAFKFCPNCGADMRGEWCE